MKMDETQKRRMWKVAAIHFVCSLASFFYPLYLVKFGHIMGYSADYYQAFVMQAVAEMFFKCALALQPQFFLVVMFSGTVGKLVFLSFLTIPIWSICFGWLYVKFTNWLNHFPVL